MLAALRISNFVLIDQLELRFGPGLNVLTGETGAGKSIVIGALALVLGNRARTDVVRPGSHQAEVEALFDLSELDTVRDRVRAWGVDCEDELVIRRVVSESGRSRAYINGRLGTAKQLASLAAELADITSQHESVALANPGKHLHHLDRYAGLEAQRHELASLVDELNNLKDELHQWRDKMTRKAEREDYLRYQLDGIDSVGPNLEEDRELREELGRLEHAQTLRQTSHAVAAGLEADDGSETEGLCDALASSVGQLHAAAELDTSLRDYADELDSIWSRLRELAVSLRDYATHVEANPKRIEELHERLFRVETLMRRHGPSIHAVLQTRARIASELRQLEQSDVQIEHLEQELATQLQVAAKLAGALSKKRHTAASELGGRITHELKELGMGSARVVVEVAIKAATESKAPKQQVDQGVSSQGDELSVAGPAGCRALLSRDGLDRVQFLIAPNKGMQPRPLQRIASGGELSRSLLALKRALASTRKRRSPAPLHDDAELHREGVRAGGIQVFDEVDTGVGGKTADRIGQAMAALAAERQVLCITHLASIAAYADTHFVVEKQHLEDKTLSRVVEVQGRKRYGELGRMLSGTKSSLKAARELVQQAQEIKQRLASAAPEPTAPGLSIADDGHALLGSEATAAAE